MIHHRTTNNLIITACLAVAIGISASNMATAQSTSSANKINAANNLVRAGKYTEAISAYSEITPGDAEKQKLNYNLAIAHYRNGDVDAAKTIFNKVAGSTNQQLASDSQYNLGNCHYSTALPLVESNQVAAITELEQAIRYYRGSLRPNPNNADARANIELAGELLRSLKKEQERQEEQEQNQQQKQDQNQDDQKQDDQEQQQDDQKQDSEKTSDQKNSDEQNQEDQQSEEQREQQENQDQENQDRESQNAADQKEQNAADQKEQNSNNSSEPSQDQPQESPQDDPSKSSSDDTSEQQQDPSNETQPDSANDSEQANTRNMPQQDSKNPADTKSKNDDSPKDSNQAQQPVPEGDLKAANQQDEKQPAGAVAKSQEGRERLMTREEALKLLQSVRDRDMLRRMNKQQLERSRRVPVERDW